MTAQAPAAPATKSKSRELTEVEKDYWYGRALWPCCKQGGYIAGPTAGIRSRHVMCQRCGTKMNVIDPWVMFDRKWLPFTGQMLREPKGYRQPKMPLLRRLALKLGA